MRNRITFLALGGAALISGLSFLIYGMATSVTTDKLVIAQTFGQYQAFLMSSNYSAAYQLMAGGYKTNHSFAGFRDGCETKFFELNFRAMHLIPLTPLLGVCSAN